MKPGWQPCPSSVNLPGHVLHFFKVSSFGDLPRRSAIRSFCWLYPWRFNRLVSPDRNGFSAFAAHFSQSVRGCSGSAILRWEWRWRGSIRLGDSKYFSNTGLDVQVIDYLVRSHLNEILVVEMGIMNTGECEGHP